MMEPIDRDIAVHREDPRSPDALRLLSELSGALEAITGCSGAASFDPADMGQARSVFAVARDKEGSALGCGAIRPMGDSTAELKRMYAREKGRGVGSAMLAFLEKEAGELGYAAIRLETRAVNEGAVGFYLSHGYRIIPNYGKYEGRQEAVCFEKQLPLG